MSQDISKESICVIIHNLKVICKSLPEDNAIREIVCGLIAFIDLILGCDKKVNPNLKHDNCPLCNGAGKLEITSHNINL